MPYDSQTTTNFTAFGQKSRAKVIDMVCAISAFLALVSAFIGRDSLPYAICLVVLACLFFIALLFRLNARTATKYVVPIATTCWIIYMCFAFGNKLGTQNYLIIALVAMSIYAKNNFYRAFSIITIIIMAVFISVYHENNLPIYTLPKAIQFLFAVNVFTPLTIISLICWSLIRDVSRANSIIQKQKIQLEGSNHFKDKLLSIIGHDMRSPFNSAKSLLNMLDRQLLSEEEQQQIVKKLHNDIDLSLQTLDNILGWASQSYYGTVMKNRIKKEKLNLSEMVEHTIASFTHLADQKKISLINKTVDAAIYADRQQIAFVLRNLASNALKFSHPDQQIFFSSSEQNNLIIFEVKDHGIGMPSNVHAALFSIESRSSQIGTSNERGSGLGLIFCKEFIENNGGELWIDSEPGLGTTVSFSIPLTHQNTSSPLIPS